MKNVKLLAAAGMLSPVSFASFAHPVSVTADTRQRRSENRNHCERTRRFLPHHRSLYRQPVHMTAELSK